MSIGARGRTVPALLFAVASTACATTGSTLGSGVGDTLLDRPPYYAGPADRVAAPERLGHLPVMYQRGATHPSFLDPDLGPEIAALLDGMTAYLDSLGVGPALAEGGRVSAVASAAAAAPPDVRFGCETEYGAPGADCVERGDSALGRGPQYMQLSVGRPAPEWVAWAAERMDDLGVDQAVVVTLEVGHYWTRQRGLRGTKEVLLGTGHTQELPWLTSLETPVSVLQLTGAVVGRDGKAVRIGAEGLTARRTRMAVSAIGGQELITAEDLRGLEWRDGLARLVAGLTGRAASSRVAS